MIKEILQEIEFVLKHPFISIFIMGTMTGVIPCLLYALVLKMF
jgi:hypothetical protein